MERKFNLAWPLRHDGGHINHQLFIKNWRLSTTVCCRCTEELSTTQMMMNCPLMRAVLWCKRSWQPVTHINVSNLLTEQDVTSVGSYCTRGSQRDTRGWKCGGGGGGLTWTAGHPCFLFSIYYQMQHGGCLDEKQKNARGQRTYFPSGQFQKVKVRE